MFGRKVYLISVPGAGLNQIKELEDFLKENEISAKVIARQFDVQEL